MESRGWSERWVTLPCAFVRSTGRVRVSLCDRVGKPNGEAGGVRFAVAVAECDAEGAGSAGEEALAAGHRGVDEPALRVVLGVQGDDDS